MLADAIAHVRLQVHAGLRHDRDDRRLSSILPPEDHDLDGPNRHRLRAAGKAGPGIELRVVDADTGEDAPVGDVGEILIRSPQNMKGYWNLPEDTAETLVAGRLAAHAATPATSTPTATSTSTTG